MFVRQNQQQFRNSNADVQIFYGDGSSSTNKSRATWNKPPGVSHVYMMLIGPGGNGNGSTIGGGSGAITVFYCAAQNIYDTLFIWVGPSGGDIYVTDSSGNVYFTAAAGSTAGASSTGAPALASMGFYQSTAGQNGSSSSISASATTFLSGGAASSTNLAGNYNYTLGSSGEKNGFFLLQPIIVGLGGMGSGNGGIGCGGGINGKGGQGMVLIASW